MSRIAFQPMSRPRNPLEDKSLGVGLGALVLHTNWVAGAAESTNCSSVTGTLTADDAVQCVSTYYLGKVRCPSVCIRSPCHIATLLCMKKGKHTAIRIATAGRQGRERGYRRLGLGATVPKYLSRYLGRAGL